MNGHDFLLKVGELNQFSVNYIQLKKLSELKNVMADTLSPN